MLQEIKTITFSGVNCYLINAGGNFILIDSGFARSRKDIGKELENSGCRPGNLKLIFITHGDPDHTGNAAYFKSKFGAKIAMNKADSGMAERGDLLGSRNVNAFVKLMARMLSYVPSMGLRKSDRFKTDLFVEDGWDFPGYGFDARALYIPGHSNGSMGVLTANGDLFCGDLLVNRTKPAFSPIYIEKRVANTSVEKLKKLNVNTVYPGHGKPFRWDEFLKNKHEG